MTIMIIDYKANTGKSIESYRIDRTEWPDLWELVAECMHKDVYMIKVYVAGNEEIKAYNYR